MSMLLYKFGVYSTVQLFIHLRSLFPCVSLHSVLGGVESRGVLRKISDMLEVILKRMDSLSKLDNTSTTDARRLDELSSAINRYVEFSSFIWQFYSVSVLIGFVNHQNSYYTNQYSLNVTGYSEIHTEIRWENHLFFKLSVTQIWYFFFFTHINPTWKHYKMVQYITGVSVRQQFSDLIAKVSCIDLQIQKSWQAGAGTSR